METKPHYSTQEGREISKIFLEEIFKIPEGKKILTCIQCGTCSASCPTSNVMEYSPREIIAALREKMIDKVLRSNTVWLCTSCYYCTVRCPQGIKFTDIMYELKRLGIHYGIYPKGNPAPHLSRTFVNMVDWYGRNHEPFLLMVYYLRVGFWKILRHFPLALKLLLKGRIGIRPHRIKGIDDLRKITDALKA